MESSLCLLFLSSPHQLFVSVECYLLLICIIYRILTAMLYFILNFPKMSNGSFLVRQTRFFESGESL